MEARRFRVDDEWDILARAAETVEPLPIEPMDLFVNKPEELNRSRKLTPWGKVFRSYKDETERFTDWHDYRIWRPTSVTSAQVADWNRLWHYGHGQTRCIRVRFFRRARWALRADPNAQPFDDERDWRSPIGVREEYLASRGPGKRGRAALAQAQADWLAWETPLVDWQSPYDMFLSRRRLDRSIVRSSSSSLPSLSSAESSPATVSDEWVGEVVEQVTYGDAKVSKLLLDLNSH